MIVKGFFNALKPMSPKDFKDHNLSAAVIQVSGLYNESAVLNDSLTISGNRYVQYLSVTTVV